MERVYLTSEDVARIARTSASTVRYWRMRNEGPKGIKVGKRVLYLEQDVLDWLDAKAATAA